MFDHLSLKRKRVNFLDVFLLGAGRPARGHKPSALKEITRNTRAMDWQIHSFKAVCDISDFYYMGGYHADEVIQSYPHLNFTVIPEWEKLNVLHTFAQIPFAKRSACIAYSDTVFRKEVISAMLSIKNDVVFCVDSLWKKRYQARTERDIRAAETIAVPGYADEVEFTGLIYLSEKARVSIASMEIEKVGTNLLDLIAHLKNTDLSVSHFDVKGQWAEFNSPRDIAHFILGTKAETLARLEPLVMQSHIGKQVSFTVADYNKNAQVVLQKIESQFGQGALIVRSSSTGEDGWQTSNAGGFESVLNVNGADKASVSSAIGAVIDSYGQIPSKHDQILVQAHLKNVQMSGVVFTCGLETGSPYYRFNFDDKTQSTESVTAGTQDGLRTVIVSRFAPHYLEKVEPSLLPVFKAIQELEGLLGFDKLDIEFAVGQDGKVHIFQVRPITVDHSAFEVDPSVVESGLRDAKKRFVTKQTSLPSVYGTKTIFANMSDWNPAEIIGTRPKPLAFSLYRYLITNDVWAKQRAEFGYCDVRPAPLIFSLAEQPYVDVRASLNSFIPSHLDPDIAARLAQTYIEILADNPYFHDKIEFDIAFTVWTPTFVEEAKKRLMPYGFKEEEILKIETALKDLTCKALLRLEDDTASIKTLHKRRAQVQNSHAQIIDKIFSLLYDCKEYGTLAFSHAARAGFVATTLMKSMISTGTLSKDRYGEFLKSFSTVAGDFKRDKQLYQQGRLSQDELVSKYGHLRPGTYEVTAQAYWEDPPRYLAGEEADKENTSSFVFSQNEKNGIEQLLKALGSKVTVDQFTGYLARAIQAREFVKFEFTKNLSAALDLCVAYGQEQGISREDLSFLAYEDIEALHLNAATVSEVQKKIKTRQQIYAMTHHIELPSLIRGEEDFYCFERFSAQPNFITMKKVQADIGQPDRGQDVSLEGKIALIPRADPGYDWLFGQGIVGLITQYGGANSHMAIRAAEIGLPAAIGVGDKLYEQIAQMKSVELDCASQLIQEVL